MQEGEGKREKGGRERESSGYIVLPQLNSFSWRFPVAACSFLVCFRCCSHIVVVLAIVVVVVLVLA